MYALEGVLLVGFLKFLKREKKESLEELDLPPAPPPLEDFQTESGNIYGFEENAPFPDLGEKQEAKELPEFDFPEFEEKISAPEPSEENVQFPEFPEIKEEPLPPIGPVRVSSQIPEQMPQQAAQQQAFAPQMEMRQESSAQEIPKPQEAYQKIERRLFRQEREISRMPAEKTIYLKVDKFKAMLSGINTIRSDIRKSEEALIKLENIKDTKDKSFDKVKYALEDLQKKLIFIDKTLFEGD